MADIIVIQPQGAGQDVVIDSAAPTTASDLASPGNETLTVSSTQRVLLKFPLRKIPFNFKVTNAKIGLFLKAGSVSVTVHRVLSHWDRNATWNNRQIGVPWTNAGGDFDTAIASGSLSGSNTWAYLGDAGPLFLELVTNWLTERAPNFGVLLQISGGASVTAYAMNDKGQSYVDQGDTVTPASERSTKFHPVLILEGDIDRVPTDHILSGTTLAVEPRATRWTLIRPTTNLPQTLADGVAYLDNPQNVTDIVADWSFTRSRKALGSNVDLKVYRDKAEYLEGAWETKDFWYPMEVVELEERVFGTDSILPYAKMGMAVIDGDQEARENDITTITLQCRDPAIYGLISVVAMKLAAEKIDVPDPPDDDGVGMSRRDGGTGYWIMYYPDPVTKEQLRNWVSDPAPAFWTGSGDNKKYWTDTDQITILHGLGEVWIEKGFYAASTDDGGLGNPTPGPDGQFRASFLRWTTPLDDYFKCMPVNLGIYKVLQDAGYHHVESAGFLYIKNLPPVLGDFVFDRVVYQASGFAALDFTQDAQHESGDKLQIGPVALNHVGDALYFKLNQNNGRFNWVYFIPYQPAIGGSYVWEIWTGAWTQIAPYFSDDDTSEDAYRAWLRGSTTPGADQLKNEGLITFKESDLANWTISALDFGLGSETDGFYMRVRCTAAPTQAPIIHRWAGKETLTIGQDTSSSVFKYYDENHHLELVQQLIDKWGVPNYYVSIDRYGDVVAQYITHKRVPDYTLTPLEKIERIRDSTKIYTEVRVKVKEFDNEAVLDYAATLNGGVASHTGIAFTDKDSNPQNTGDDSNQTALPKNITTLTSVQKQQRGIDGSEKTGWGIDYKAGTGKGRVDLRQLQNLPFYQVDFATTVKLMGFQCGVNLTPNFRVEGYYPDEDPPVWKTLPGCNNLKGKSSGALLKAVDFTVDSDPDRPVISKVRFIPTVIEARNGSYTDCSRFKFEVWTCKCLGVAVGEILEGVAILGITPPFTTATDQALMARYWRRVFAVENNPFITSKEEADREALNILRELFRLMDPLEISGIYPLVEIGETVKIQYDQLAIANTYVVEEVAREPKLRYTAGLTPYRFSDFNDPPLPEIPDRIGVDEALVPDCLPLATGGGGEVEAGLFAWYRADQLVSTGTAPPTAAPCVLQTLAWGDFSGHENTLDPLASMFGGPCYEPATLNNLPVISCGHMQSLHSTGGNFGPPLHFFGIFQIDPIDFAPGSTILDIGGSLALNRGGVDTQIVMSASPSGPTATSTNGASGAFILVEALWDGANSYLSVEGETDIEVDLGPGSSGNLTLAPGATFAEMRFYNTKQNTAQSLGIRATMRSFWGLP